MKPVAALLAIALVGCGPATQGSTTTESPSTTSQPAPTTSVGATTTRATTTTTTSTTTIGSIGALRILFIGNSHTSTHDIPGTVEALMESAAGCQVDVATFNASSLRGASGNASITDAIASGDWDVVVLQGQEISQSHSISYSQTEAISLAKLASSSGARPLLFSEWRREFIDETAYIEGIYDEIAAESGAEVIPVGQAWDRFLEGQPDYELWSSDGNHSSADGAFIAAATIAYFIAGPGADLATEPAFLQFLETARVTVQDYLSE